MRATLTTAIGSPPASWTAWRIAAGEKAWPVEASRTAAGSVGCSSKRRRPKRRRGDGRALGRRTGDDRRLVHVGVEVDPARGALHHREGAEGRQASPLVGELAP